MKYGFDEKLSTVLLVLQSGYSVREAALKYGIGKTHIRRWVNLYQAHGEEGLRHKFHAWSMEFKMSVLEYMRQNHLSLSATAVHFGIPHDSTVREWDSLYRTQGVEGLTPKPRGRPPMNREKPKIAKPETPATEHELLLAENERLRAENAYLKKWRA
jgi:transposase-like protein